jgi:regulatory factor X
MSTHSNRPLSRASTTSINSFEQHSQTHNGQTQYPQQPPQQTHYQHPLSNSFSAEYPPLEAALLQVAQHAQQSEDISLDSMQQLMAYSAQPPHSMSQHNGLPTDQQPFDVNHGHVIHHTADQLPPPPSAPIEVEEKKKKGSASGSATNDKELRAMLAQNQGRVLQDVAAEVIATDRTSKAEKSKQLFAMLW